MNPAPTHGPIAALRAGAAPRWLACVHVSPSTGRVLHPSIVEWLARVREAAVILAVDARCVAEFDRFLAACSERFHVSPVRIVVTAGTGSWDVLARVHRESGGCDVAFVHAGARVADDWDVLLGRALDEGERIGVVSPLSAASEVFSPFAGEKPAWMDAESITRWLSVLSRGLVFDAPGIVPFCGYWRGAALAQLLDRASPADWRHAVREMARLGWARAGCDWVYVDAPERELDAGPGSQPGLEPIAASYQNACGDAREIRAFLVHHPLSRIRHAFGEAGEWGAPSVPPRGPLLKPVQLHVTHSWGGGLGRWIEDMCEADSGRWNLVLRSIGTWGAFGQRIALYRSHQMDKPLRDWQLDMPIGSIATTHFQYRKLLEEVIRDFRVDAMIVSSLIGHSLDVLDQDIPVLLVAHDYAPFCPALVIRFGEVCTTCTTERLGACFADNPLNRFFREAGADYWSGIRECYLELLQRESIRMAVPSASVARNLARLEPVFERVPTQVIPHGMAFGTVEPWEPAGGRLKLLVLGSLAAQKGAELLAAALPDLERYADLYLVGCGDEGAPFERLGPERVIRRYRREELPGIVARIAPHAGLLLSIVPETFSYTLSELWATGVPPVATRLGGFADRIADGVNGFLIEPSANELVETVRRLDGDRASLAAVRANVLAMPVRTREEMVADYHRAIPLDARRGVPGVPPSMCRESASLDQIGALYVDRQVPLRTVLADFSDYLGQKIERTPRLNGPSRRALRMVLRLLRRAIR